MAMQPEQKSMNVITVVVKGIDDKETKYYFDNLKDAENFALSAAVCKNIVWAGILHDGGLSYKAALKKAVEDFSIHIINKYCK